MGRILIQPLTNEPDDLAQATLVVFPHRIGKNHFNVAVEWAASTQIPIFCHARDIPRFEGEGFGSYRFHKLDGFKEIDFQGGTVEFYPARRRPVGGVRGFVMEIGEALGMIGTPSFHLLVRAREERPVLYLSTAQIDLTEWELLNRSRPSIILGSAAVPKHEWLALGSRTQKKILWAGELSDVVTEPLDATKVAAEKEAWPAKAGSF